MNDSVTQASRVSRASIESLVAMLLEAIKRRDSAACAALFTDDGLILSPYGPSSRGTDEIAATHQAWFDEGETNKRMTLLDADASGDLGRCPDRPQYGNRIRCLFALGYTRKWLPRLENRRPLTGTVGSNLTLSAARPNPSE
jgi:hypothetical protein